MVEQSTADFLTDDGLSMRHGFFTRRGGVSRGVYDSLQCGWGASGDPRANVAENRARVARALGVAPERLVSQYQTHSDRVVTIDGAPDPLNSEEADGLVTATPGVALAALAADCAPVLFEDAEARVIGACHAGWKGALGGILEATVSSMTALGATPARIQAVIGPCISAEHYEVGPEYVERFLAADGANERFFSPATDPDTAAKGHAQFDLPGFVISRLEAAGVGAARALGRCTYGEPALFFSNRRALHRAEDDYGRLLSAIVIET